jgi:hypothetical protein
MRHSPQPGPGMPVRRASSALSSVRVSKGRSPRAYGRLGCGARGIGACPKRLHETTLLTITALPTDTVTVTDPTHPLYGRTFPLVGVTTKQHLGRVCVVWLYPGVERVIPLAAASLAEPPPPPSPCKLSVAGLHTLLAVVASLVDLRQEDTHGQALRSSASRQSPTAIPTFHRISW